MRRIQAFVVSAILMCTFTVASQAAAQSRFPIKPIKVVVPNAAGGATDVFARKMAAHMASELGTPVVVANLTGGGGNIAATNVAHAPPDGYTIFLGTNIISANPSLYTKVDYNPITSFTPISLLVKFSYVLVADPRLPVKNVGDLVTLLKNNPGKYSYASGGTGTAIHFTGALFKSVAGVDIGHVPYRGEAPAIADVIGGHVPFTFCTIPSALPHIKSKDLIALAVSAPKRSALLPEVPALSSVLPGFSMPASWFGMLVPSGTPSDVVSKLNAAALAALRAQDVVEFVHSMGGEAVGTSSEDFGAFIRAEIPRWAHLIQISGAKVE